MDGIKLDKWRASFENKVKDLKPAYDSLMRARKFEESYSLELDETSHAFYIRLDPELSVELQDRFEKLLLETEPEDSI